MPSLFANPVDDEEEQRRIVALLTGPQHPDEVLPDPRMAHPQVDQVSSALPDSISENDDHQKKIDKLMEQVGLHPSQVSFRQNLGIEPTQAKAEPAPPLVNSAPVAQPAVAEKPGMRIPSPTAPNPIIQHSREQVLDAQKELARMQKTGSGISQIKNPFFRTLARVGDIAGTMLFPAAPLLIPGTESHHQMLMNQQHNLIETGLKDEGDEAKNQETIQKADAEGKQPLKLTNDLEVWVQQNPGKPISEFWKAKTEAEGGKKSPDEQTFNYLVGTLKLPQDEALKRLSEIKSEVKPDNKTQQEQAMEALLQKAFPGGTMDPKFMSDSEALAKGITDSANVDPTEKGKLMSYFIFHPSPASQGTSANIRGTALQEARIGAYYDSKTNTMISMNAKEFNEANRKEPGRFVDEGKAAPLRQKEAIFQDIYFNERQTREAIAALKNGFDIKQRAQIAFMLKSTDPHSALDSFFNSSVGKTLSEDQMMYITALASLQENALALRTISGLGQGSDELRSMILKTLPGAGTPNIEYANRQMDLFKNTVDRLHSGVIKAGTGNPDEVKPPEQKTEPKKKLTRVQVEQAAKAAGMSYEDAKKDAEAHGVQVTE